MSESEEVTKLKAEIAQLRKHVVRHHQLTDAPFLKNYAPYNGLDKPTQDDFNAVLDDLRHKGASIHGDNAYKRDLCDSIVRVLAFGAQNTNPPPADHWGQRFWDIGREERAMQEELLESLSNLVGLAKLCAARLDRYHAAIAHAEAVIAKATR